ncbi:hypothetical protein [Sagittula salina]|uniref:Uncharacterized protein n=1 Tax=Sagittula salina TaxID=2820268 RepID=A0A940MS89_9RHOB|nr:hypothetical protein [Sagittula salina]MBP0482054.1 hypothetical protein [Sagittula salina]
MSIFEAEKLGVVVLAAMIALPAHGQTAEHADGEHVGEDAQMLTVTTAPVQADISLGCQFDRECLEDEACSDSGFPAMLDAHAGGLDPEVLMVEANLVAEDGTTFLVGARDHGRLSLSGGDFEARHLLTVSAEGDARYTVHYAEGPMMVSYLGRCEADE